MLDYMVKNITKDGEKTVYECDSKYGDGGMISYDVCPGISIYYCDFHIHEPYDYKGAYNYQDLIEINYCLSGRYECEFSDQSVNYTTDGDFSFWSGRGEVVASDSSAKRYKGISVYILPEFAQDEINKIIITENIDLKEKVKETFSGKTSLIAKPGARIHHIFDELYDLPNKNKLDYIRIKIFELILLIYTDDFKYEESLIKYYPKKVIDAVKETKKYIDNHFSRYITISEMAKINAINSNQLMECFKYTYGMTLGEYIKKVRMAKAESLLVETDIKIADISLMVGYSNASKFSEAFKRIYGTSPIKYRKQSDIKIKSSMEHF